MYESVNIVVFRIMCIRIRMSHKKYKVITKTLHRDIHPLQNCDKVSKDNLLSPFFEHKFYCEQFARYGEEQKSFTLCKEHGRSHMTTACFRPFFEAGNFYPGIDINYLYKFETQIETLTGILKSRELANERLRKSVQFLARGHMAAKADFVYGSQQRATFWYLNTAPQWQSFNGGNWNLLESSVRYFVSRRRLDLDVYTGAYGQMTMEDIYGEQQPVYLHVESEVVSAPKFYWKVIYDPLSKLGTAFVGLNDPFIKSITSDIYICEDISEKIRWLNWNPHNITAGISYACTVDDLREAVPAVPKFDVIGILT